MLLSVAKQTWIILPGTKTTSADIINRSDGCYETVEETIAAITANCKYCKKCVFCLYVTKYQVNHKIRRVKFMAYYLSQTISWGKPCVT